MRYDCKFYFYLHRNPSVSGGASRYLPAMPEAGGQQVGQARAW